MRVIDRPDIRSLSALGECERLTKVLQEIAMLAHDGGRADMTERDVLAEICRRTLPFWEHKAQKKGATK